MDLMLRLFSACGWMARAILWLGQDGTGGEGAHGETSAFSGTQRDAGMFYQHKQQFTTFIASSPYTTAWFTEFCPENGIQRCAAEDMPKLSKSVESPLGNLAEERHRVAYMQLEAWRAWKSDLGQSSPSHAACTHLTTSAEAVKFYCQKRSQLCSEAFSEISLHLKSQHS